MLAIEPAHRNGNPISRYAAHAALTAALLMAAPAAATEAGCAPGAYRLSDGSVIDIATAAKAHCAGEASTVRAAS